MEELHPTKQLIFDAIEELILTQGLEAVTFSELAKRCYLQPSGIIYYFKTKTNMLCEFFEYELRRITDVDILEGTGVMETADPVEAFCLLIDTLLFSQSYSEPLSSALLRSTSSAPVSDQPTRDLMVSCLRGSIQAAVQKILLFRDKGIFEESRFSASLSLFVYAALGYQYTGRVGYNVPEDLQEFLSPHLLADAIKRSFLKDGTSLPGSGNAPGSPSAS